LTGPTVISILDCAQKASYQDLTPHLETLQHLENYPAASAYFGTRFRSGGHVKLSGTQAGFLSARRGACGHVPISTGTERIPVEFRIHSSTERPASWRTESRKWAPHWHPLQTKFA